MDYKLMNAKQNYLIEEAEKNIGRFNNKADDGKTVF